MHRFQKSILQVMHYLLLLVSVATSSVQAAKKAEIVMCAESGAIFHEKNADVVTHPASLTKMMTLYMTFKALRDNRLTYDQHLLVSKHASKQIPCKLWLKPGSTITVRQAILGLVTKSANDASVAIAEALGNGSEAQFAQLMTQEARRLGMSKTVFKNSSGVPNKAQVTTARDMAILSRSLYKHFPREFAFFKEQKFTYKGQTHRNHNHLLGKIPGVDGIKTGFINASGFNLAASMVHNKKRIVAVVLGGDSSKSRDKRMIELLKGTHKLSNPQSPNRGSGRYASIGDIINTLGPSEANASPVIGSLKKASYLAKDGKIKPIKSELGSLDDLINVIESKPGKPKLIKAKSGLAKAKTNTKVKCKNKPKGKLIKEKVSYSNKCKKSPQSKKRKIQRAI